MVVKLYENKSELAVFLNGGSNTLKASSQFKELSYDTEILITPQEFQITIEQTDNMFVVKKRQQVL